jgi:hypothetical protein
MIIGVLKLNVYCMKTIRGRHNGRQLYRRNRLPDGFLKNCCQSKNKVKLMKPGTASSILRQAGLK